MSYPAPVSPFVISWKFLKNDVTLNLLNQNDFISSSFVLNLQLKASNQNIKADQEDLKDQNLKEFEEKKVTIEDQTPNQIEKGKDQHCEFCQNSPFDEGISKRHHYCDRNISYQNNFF